MNPLAPDFWEQYQSFMENTMKNTQKLMSELGNQPNFFSAGKTASTAETTDWQRVKSPEIKLDDNSVIISFNTAGMVIDNSNTRIALEGYRLIIEGALEAQIPLPVAVQKYGGKAVSKKNVLEIKLLRDKYNTQALISIEKGN